MFDLERWELRERRWAMSTGERIRERMECREGLFGIGGSGAKTTRNSELGAWGALSNIGSWANTFGQNQSQAGANNLNTAANFWNTILGGNRGAISQLIAPEVSTIQNQTNEQIQTAGQFGNRSGGTNAAQVADASAGSTAIQNLINTIFSQAPTQLASVGAEQEGLGLGAVGTAESAYGTIGGQATSILPTQLQLQQEIQGSEIEALLNVAGGLGL